MLMLTTPDEMRAWSRQRIEAGERIGVVPTMGALHGGHLALIDAVRDAADVIVVTIFVNPLQFNEPADFDGYPRPIDDDLATCAGAGVEVVYAPTAATMYPPGFQTAVEPGDLARRLEGPMRPGHFRGVTTVVAKLFGAVRPDVAAFGQKDFQQLAIVRRLVTDLDLGVEVVGVPIVRESDGLALSSRNVRLTPAARAAAPVLHRALRLATEAFETGEHDAAAVRSIVTGEIEREPMASVEYVEVVDAHTLESVVRLDGSNAIVVAAWFGDVRLIDNVVLQ